MRRTRMERGRARRGLAERQLRFECCEERRLLAADLHLLADLNSEPEIYGLSPKEFVSVGGVAYFSATSPTLGRELWRSDGTAAGTYPVRDINLGSDGSSPELLTVVGDRLYFIAQDGVTPHEQLWTSDGTAAGTHLVKAVSNASSSPGALAGIGALGDAVYFVVWGYSDAWELWRTTGDEAGTTLVTTFGDNFLGFRPSNLTAVGETLFFSMEDDAHGVELWKTDGTAEGTSLVRDINPDAAGSEPMEMMAHDGMLYFSATTAAWGRELWKSDGTAAGTQMVRELRPGTAGSDPHALREIDGELFFLATNGGSRLFRSDGTMGGTVEIALAEEYVEFQGQLFVFGLSSILKGDLSGGSLEVVADFRSPSLIDIQPTVAGDTLYYASYDNVHYNEVWATDGASEGTRLVKETISRPGSSSSDLELFGFGDKLLFHANSSPADLWISDGTEAGTLRVRESLESTDSAEPTNLVQFQGFTYFLANVGHRPALWKTDGVSAPTLIKENLGNGASLDYMVVGGDSLFIATAGATSGSLWRSDGTAEGTTLITGYDGRIPRLSQFPMSSFFAYVGGELFFVVQNNSFERELWKTDGTTEGTSRVEAAGETFIDVLHLAAAGDRLAFVAHSSAHGDELWISDGTSAGTQRVSDVLPGEGSGLAVANPWLTSVGDAVYFAARQAPLNTTLWKWTPTGGVESVSGDVLISVGVDYAMPVLRAVGETIYFVGNQGTSVGLWKTDGTQAGTTLVKNFPLGFLSSQPSHLTAGDGVVYFTANDGAGGVELWRSNGTEAGTALVREIVPGPANGKIRNLTFLDGRLYFSAATAGIGDEIWKSDGTAAGTFLLADVVAGQGGSEPGAFAVHGDRLLFAATTDELGRELWSVDLKGGPTPLGDFDGDGAVSGNDFLAWQRALGSAVDPAGGGADANRNGVVDFGDLAAWRANLGAVATAAAEDSPSAAVAAMAADESTTMDDAIAALGAELYAGEATMPRTASAMARQARPLVRLLLDAAPVRGVVERRDALQATAVPQAAPRPGGSADLGEPLTAARDDAAPAWGIGGELRKNLLRRG